jgi:prophage DNA circulation protein
MIAPNDVLALGLSSTEYEGIVFPATESRTSWGHDSVRHTRYRAPGVEIETTGRKPREIKLSIPLVEGMVGPWGENLFTQTYEQLVAKFQAVPLGQLSHPTLGPIVAHVDSVEEVLSSDIANAVMLEVTFTEHLGADETIVDESGNPAPQVETRAARVDAALAAVPAERRPASVESVMVAQMDAAESADTPSEALAALQTMRSTVAAVLALPDLGDASYNELRLSAELLSVSVEAYEARILRLTSPRVYVVPAVMSLTRIARVVYGDSRRMDLLRGANRIADELAVPAGTVLVIPEPPDASR